MAQKREPFSTDYPHPSSYPLLPPPPLPLPALVPPNNRSRRKIESGVGYYRIARLDPRLARIIIPRFYFRCYERSNHHSPIGDLFAETEVRKEEKRQVSAVPGNQFIKIETETDDARRGKERRGGGIFSSTDISDLLIYTSRIYSRLFFECSL